MSPFLLVHGAWHSAWCWRKVTPLLEAAQHNVVAVDLPGHGDDKTPVKDLCTNLYVETLCKLILSLQEPVTLVGHSMAGMLISQVAEYIPHRIKALVYVSGFLLKDGQCIRDIESEVTDSLVSANLVLSTDKRSICVPTEFVREAFYNDCTDIDFNFANSRIRPEPVPLFITPIKISEEKYGTVPRIYVECLQDRALPVNAQRKMYNKLGCKIVYTLDASHSPFFSKSSELAEILLESCSTPVIA